MADRTTTMAPTVAGLTIKQGATYAVAWGTDIYAVGSFSSYILKSVRVGDRGEEIKIEGGVGLTAVFALLNDGKDFEFVLVDNAKVTLPLAAPGDTLTVLDPFTGSVAAKAICCLRNMDAARKQEGTLTIPAKNFTLITLT